MSIMFTPLDRPADGTALLLHEALARSHRR